MKIVIYEDDCYYAKILSNTIYAITDRICSYSDIVLKTWHRQKVLDYAQNTPENTLFLIDLFIHDEKTGIDLALEIKSLNNRHMIVFLTNYIEELRFEGMAKVKALSIIDKTSPHLSYELEAALSEASAQIKSSSILIINNTYSLFHSISMDEIYSIEIIKAAKRFTIFHTNGITETNGTVNKLLASLDQRFIEIYRGVIVNMAKIVAVQAEARKIYLSDGRTLYFARDRKRVFLDAYTRYIH